MPAFEKEFNVNFIINGTKEELNGFEETKVIGEENDMSEGKVDIDVRLPKRKDDS
jgi:hypothetical protein